jgi:hypothetical protein
LRFTLRAYLIYFGCRPAGADGGVAIARADGGGMALLA